jgi:hypothetical protein
MQLQMISAMLCTRAVDTMESTAHRHSNAFGSAQQIEPAFIAACKQTTTHLIDEDVGISSQASYNTRGGII